MAAITKKSEKLLDEYESNKCLYENFINQIKHLVESILRASEITVNGITSRLKTKDSLKGKIDRKGDKYSTLSDITDIAGIRIITYFAKDVDKIAEIIEKEFDVDKENTIDKREALGDDKFGYCSLHYVVKMSKQRLKLKEYCAYQGLKCEIQIRSVLQHAWAEIEHDIGYKSAITVPKEIRRNFSRIAGLLELADKEFDEIRESLSEYEKAAASNIDKKEFIDHEIDAVILETMINQNSDVIRLNKHLANLMGKELVEFDNFSAEQTIKELKWFGIVTVGELSSLISLYTDFAFAIASEKLKNYKPKKDSVTTTLIAFFYLCYAILLKEHLNVEEIKKYLMDLHIGGIDLNNKIANDLYELGLKLANKKE